VGRTNKSDVVAASLEVGVIPSIETSASAENVSRRSGNALDKGV